MRISSLIYTAFFLCLLPIYCFCQTYTEAEKLSGYALRGDQMLFIFAAENYSVAPEKIVVTGIFRGWSQDMDDPDWNLQKDTADQTLWILQVDNVDFNALAPGNPFKFRINSGSWLDPPADAPNAQGGNLIFMHDYKLPDLKAEIINNRSIWVKIEGVERSLDPEDYKLTTWDGKPISISAVLPNTASETLIHTATAFDHKRVHFLEIPGQELKTTCTFDAWFRHLYSSKELGANIAEDGKSTSFRVFAPRVEAMKLYFYKSHDDKVPFETIDMVEDENGVWEYVVRKNLEGIYYDFTVHGPNEPGSHFFESTKTHISDPYARVNAEAHGRSRVAIKTIPATPLKEGIPKMQDLIAYEIHVQDFTDQLPVEDHLKGTMPAMTIRGLKNDRGEKIGFDYLLDLGINTVHLMPMQEFLHFPDEEWKASFADDPYMISNGVNEENYQWGYRTTHCFAVENKFRDKKTDFGSEREQFRDLVQAFHDENIAVIIDIVPNHTGENMDGGHFNFHFNSIDKQYYYRTKDFEHIGAFGNEVKTENRPMVQRWLIDQCKHFIEEFGIDGFRIDLAGQIDQQTLIALRKALGEDIIIYGEPWIGSNDPEFEANPDWDWYKEDAPITFFQDDTRNAFKGTVFDIKSKEEDRGWPGGKFVERENVMKGLSAAFPTDKTPLSGINYLDIHDNMTLADQYASKDFDGRFGVDENLYKIAATLLFTSLGPIVLHGGTEIMRSKGAAPSEEVVKVMKNGMQLAYHGKGDTYNQRIANNFLWSQVGATLKDEEIYCDYKGMHKFWRGLIHFRNSKYGEVFRKAENQHLDYYRWVMERDEKALGYIVNEEILVLLNTADYEFVFYLNELAPGKWRLIGTNETVDHVNGAKDAVERELLYGGNLAIKLPPQGIRIWVRD